MRMVLVLSSLIAVALTAHAAPGAKSAARPAAKTAAKAAAPAHAWSLNATAIEACSCPMFCTRWFGGGTPDRPSGTEALTTERFCRFNSAIKVNQGHDHGVSLDGARFWVAGDLGKGSAQGGEWAVVTFDRTLTEPQREAITRIVGKLYPVPFQSLTTDEADISWVLGPEEAHALLNNGRTAEVGLAKDASGRNARAPLIRDLLYRAANGNTGFLLMPSLVEAYRAGAHPFEHQGTTGFVITFDIHGDDPAASGVKSGD